MTTNRDSSHSIGKQANDPIATPLDSLVDIADLYSRVAEHSPLPVAMTVGPTHLLCGTNPAFCQLFKVESEALVGESLVSAVFAFDTDRVQALLNQVYQTGVVALEVDVHLKHSQPDQVYWNYIVWPILDGQGHAAGLIVLIHDTTDHRRSEQTIIETRMINEHLLIASLREMDLSEQLQRQLAFTNAITNSLGEGLYTLDRAGRFMMVNPAAERMLGWTEVELLGRGTHEIIHTQTATSVFSVAEDSPLLAVMGSGTTARDENATWTRRNGAPFPIAYSAAPIVTDGKVIGAVVAFRDMSEVRQSGLVLAQRTAELAQSRTKLEQLFTEVQVLALTDELTTLNNRRGFLTLAAQQVKVAKRIKNVLSLIFIDLDGLKEINDRWGHQVGNQALVVTAHILKATFRDTDIIARIGGDEFVVLVMEASVPELGKLLQRLQAQCTRHNMQASAPYQLSLSMGAAHSTVEQRYSLEELLEQADAQMYVHKQARRRPPTTSSAATGNK